MKIDLGNLATLISVATIGIILLSYYNLVTLYGFFGINITPFLEPSEIIFSSTFLLIIFLIMGSTFAFFGLMAPLMKITSIPAETKYPRLAKIKAHALPSLFLLTFSVPAVLLMRKVLIDVNGIEYLFMLLIIWYITREKLSNAGSLTVIIVGLIFIISDRNYNHYFDVTNNNPVYEVEIQTEKYHIKTGSDIFYIGSTKSFIFFWDRSTREAKGYSTANIEWITMKKNEKYYAH
jgi:hypothetical protein